MDLDRIPANQEGMHQLHAYLQMYLSKYGSLNSILSYSIEREHIMRGIEYGSLMERIHPRERLEVRSMTPMEYAELLYLIAKGIESKGEGSDFPTKYVKVDKSEALYANMVRGLEDRHRAILDAVDAMLDSDIPADQAKAIVQMREWRESLPQPKEEPLTDGQPKFRLQPDLEL